MKMTMHFTSILNQHCPINPAGGISWQKHKTPSHYLCEIIQQSQEETSYLTGDIAEPTELFEA